jgi:hypothetical protein
MAVLRRPFHRGAAALLGLLLVPPTAASQEPHHGEAAVKAAFLYNFTKFIDWPDSAFSSSDARFVVCAAASETFRRELEQTFESERVAGRRVAVESPQDRGIRHCHVIYFAAGQDAGARLASVRDAPILTVGEGRAFLQQGGHIAFRLHQNRVRFEISKRAADRAGLLVSSKLLRLADYVDEGAPGR